MKIKFKDGKIKEFSLGNLRGADLRGADFSGVILRGADFSGADLRNVDFSNADLSDVDLSDANLSDVDLSRVNLRGTNLSKANLSDVYFWNANLREANLCGANLIGAIFGDAELRDANFSGAIGLISQKGFLEQNFKFSKKGMIVYKSFGENFEPSESWTIKEGMFLTENVLFDRTVDCACGINVATLDWCQRNCEHSIWECLIEWMDLAGVCVPYNSDGKIRAERIKLVKIKRW